MRYSAIFHSFHPLFVYNIATSGVERATDLARAVLVRREMVWKRQRERFHADSYQLAASEGLLTYLRIEREAIAQHANKLRAPKEKHDAEVSAVPERRSHGNQYNYGSSAFYSAFHSRLFIGL